jgi:hypothetical protein
MRSTIGFPRARTSHPPSLRRAPGTRPRTAATSHSCWRMPAPSTGTKTFVTSLGGVGDDACYLDAGNGVGFVAGNDDAAFTVAVYGPRPIKSKQALEERLTRQAIVKL